MSPQWSHRRLASMFSPADLPGQFVLSRSDEAVPSGWAVHRQRGWTLGAHPWLPVMTIRTLDGADAGWILGHPITEDARFIEGVAQLRFDLHAAPDQMEAWLSRLSGRSRRFKPNKQRRAKPASIGRGSWSRR